MKTLKYIALFALIFAPVALFAQDAVAAESASSAILPDSILGIALKVVAWYGVACVGFNGLVTLIATVVKITPGSSDDAAIEKLYENKLYKAVAWIFSWGDYLAEFITKLRK